MCEEWLNLEKKSMNLLNVQVKLRFELTSVQNRMISIINDVNRIVHDSKCWNVYQLKRTNVKIKPKTDEMTIVQLKMGAGYKGKRGKGK